jgi:hypothetical protein
MYPPERLPLLFYAPVVIKEHGGEFGLVTSEKGAGVTISLPIVANKPSV